MNGEKSEKFLLSSEPGQGYLHSPLIFNTVLEIRHRAIRQDKGIKGIRIWKKEAKFLLFANDKILCIKNPKEAIKKLLELINNFSTLAVHKIGLQKLDLLVMY